MLRIDTRSTSEDKANATPMNLTDLSVIIKKLFSDTAAYLPAKISSALSGLVGVAIFTRFFTPGEYGTYVIVFTTTSILTAILVQWITQSVLRYRAQYLNANEECLFNRNLLIILAIESGLILIIGLCMYNLKDIIGDFQRYYIISVVVIIAGIWSDNLLTILQADLKALAYTSYTITGAAVRLLIPLILIIFIKKDVLFLLYGVLANSIITFPLLCSIFYRSFIEKKHNERHCDKNQFLEFLKSFYKYGFPMIGWFIGAELLQICDRYFIQFFKGNEQVGIYSANYNLVASSLAFVAFPLLTAAHPLLMKLGGEQINNKERIKFLISTFSRYFMIISVPIVIYLSFMSLELTSLLLGDEFRQGRIIFPFILIGVLMWNLSMIGHKGLELQNKTKIMLFYVVICVVIKILLNIIFIPSLGYFGAAITTLVSYITYPFLVYWGTKNYIEWIIEFPSFLRITLASFLSGLSMFLVKIIVLNLFLKLFVSMMIMALFYGLLLHLLGEIQQSEINYIRSFFINLIYSKKTNK